MLRLIIGDTFLLRIVTIIFFYPIANVVDLVRSDVEHLELENYDCEAEQGWRDLLLAAT